MRDIPQDTGSKLEEVMLTQLLAHLITTLKINLMKRCEIDKNIIKDLT